MKPIKAKFVSNKSFTDFFQSISTGLTTVPKDNLKELNEQDLVIAKGVELIPKNIFVRKELRNFSLQWVFFAITLFVLFMLGFVLDISEIFESILVIGAAASLFTAFYLWAASTLNLDEGDLGGYEEDLKMFYHIKSGKDNFDKSRLATVTCLVEQENLVLTMTQVSNGKELRRSVLPLQEENKAYELLAEWEEDILQKKHELWQEKQDRLEKELEAKQIQQRINRITQTVNRKI